MAASSWDLQLEPGRCAATCAIHPCLVSDCIKQIETDLLMLHANHPITLNVMNGSIRVNRYAVPVYVSTVSLENSDGQRNKVPVKQRLKPVQPYFSPSSPNTPSFPKSCGSVTLKLRSQSPVRLDGNIAPCIATFKRDCTYLPINVKKICLSWHARIVVERGTHTSYGSQSA